MQLEFPMMTIADKIADYFTQNKTLVCEDFYVHNLTLSYIQADNLCFSSSNFTFADPLKTAVALTNVYLYQDKYNSFYIKEFKNKTDYDVTSFYDDNNTFNIYFDQIQRDIKSHYESEGICKP